VRGDNNQRQPVMLVPTRFVRPLFFMKDGQGENHMRYLVDMTLAAHTRTPQEGIDFITTLILPTLAVGKELEEKGIILAGGPKTGQIGFSVIMQVDSVEQLDEIIERLPVWPRMHTTVTPLSSFEVREQSTHKRLEDIKRRMQERASLTPSED
jgi:muconolactone delta-isomerase